MKFSAREDIEAPINYVFLRISDFQIFERQALKRGADVQRIDSASVLIAGSGWNISFNFKGKNRKLKATVASLDTPNSIRIDAVSNGLDGVTQVELVALAPNRTRISVALDLSPKTLSARLLLQSLKFGKSSLTRRFKIQVTEFAEKIEDNYHKNV